jgi:hypothetical protein
MKQYELGFDKRDDYLLVTLKAEKINHRTVLDYLGEIADRCASTRLRKMVIDRDIPMMLSDEEMLDSWGVFLQMRPRMRIAFVNRHPDIAEPIRRLISGIQDGAARYFEDLASAEAWISEVEHA